MIPRLGQDVHYVMPDGQHRAAKIVRTFDGNPKLAVNLLVFLDGANDGAGFGQMIMWKTSIEYCGPETAGGTLKKETWHWPEFTP